MNIYGKKEEMRMRKAYRAGVKRKRAFYLKCGASAELCGELLAVDRKAFRSFMRDVCRRSDRNPEFLPAAAPRRDFSGDEWMEDIESPRLLASLAALSPEDIELLGDYVFRGYTQREIARKRKMTQGGVSRRLKRVFSKIRVSLSDGEKRDAESEAAAEKAANAGADEGESDAERGPDAEKAEGECETDENMEERDG